MQREILLRGRGLVRTNPIVLPKQVHCTARSLAAKLDTVRVLVPCQTFAGLTDSSAMPQVPPDTWRLVLEYVDFHRASGRSDKVRLGTASGWGVL